MGEVEELKRQIEELKNQLRIANGGGVIVGRARVDRSQADPEYWRLAYFVESDRIFRNGVPKARWANLAMKKDREAVIEEIPKIISDMQKLYDTLKAEG